MPSIVAPEESPPSPGGDASAGYVAVETPRTNQNATGNGAAWQRAPSPVVVEATPATAAGWDDPKTRPDLASPTTKNTFQFRDLYRYATPLDMVALLIGLLMTVINGALFPCMALIFGEAISSFQPYDHDRVTTAALYYFGVAVLLFLTDYVSFVLFHVTAERQMKALREKGFEHMLYLDITWYDQNDALQLSSRLTGDTVKIKDGMGQKLGDSLRFSAQFFTGYAIGFSKGWQISLVMASIMPCIAVSLAFLLKTMRERTEWAQKVYAEAGAVAEETLGSMRTVVSNNGEQRAIDKYNAKALRAEQENIQLAKITSSVMGVFFASMWFMYAAGLWFGGKRVSDDKTDPGSVFSAFFGILIGTMSMAQISPNITAVAQAKGAAAGLYAILDTVSQVDASQKDTGVIPPEGKCDGELEAIGVTFSYPSRPEVTILDQYNVRIGRGQTVAFVGASGGGKSTLISLLERFYDPSKGQILLDGRDIKTLNIKWLRAQIGLVSQEPVLFATTIFQNIAFGSGREPTKEDAVEAAKLANAHEFIMQLPEQYDTLVGEKGISLSGGQKQRIAIARALVRNPKILVLDEATSALDNESERIVQAALTDLMAKTNMTTLVIAHRLSTIRTVDKIVVLSGGTVVEEGPHDELMKIDKGIYKNLYTIQAGSEEQDEEDAMVMRDSQVMVVRDDAATPHQVSTGRQASDSSDSAAMATGGTPSPPEKKPSFTVKKAIALGNPEKIYFITGCLAAAVVGTSMPASALLISGLVGSMTEKYMLFHQFHDTKYLQQLYDQVQIYGLCYIGGAFVLMIATAIQQFCFKFMAEKLTSRLRDLHFSALCRQNIAFFDQQKNATGALTADLATNATKVALLSGDAQGRVVQAICTFAAAIVISFSLGSWLLTLVMLAVFPLLIFGQVIRMKQMRGGGGDGNGSDLLADSGAHASQALSNIRTIVSLGLETQMVTKYSELLQAPLKDGTKEAHVNGLALGFSSFIVLAVYSLVFWYGGTLVRDASISFQQLMRTLMAIMMSAQGIGSAAAWLADTGNASRAGSAIFDLVERKLAIDSFAKDGATLPHVEGKIEFQQITFRYPTRPEVQVLRHYNLVIEAGQTVAFCGPSGGGKSTCIALLERFYDPLKGSVLLDGHDLKTLNLQWLRSQIGLVGQEPTLFIGTIAENIAYGLERKPSQEEIEVAAKMANAHLFITQFPDGYSTQVGMKGEKLSGGQKQRIAIARAILKNPSVLLLDEATSALDSESEKIVQEALDKVIALKKRTTIIIAHRLSTIRKADKICVVSGGKIAEQGTHVELLAKGGIYKKLVAKE